MISVIMPCYLGEYPGAAAHREIKLHRAIRSCLIQQIGELIVVSDGCEKTNQIVKMYPTVQLVSIPKQSLFSGKVREAGIAIAKYDWICYLDSDDQFLPGHLKALVDNCDPTYDWYYYDDYVVNLQRSNEVAFGRIGTTSIFHKKRLNNAIWPDGYNHDWGFIQQLGTNYKKIDGARYILHHIPGKLDT